MNYDYTIKTKENDDHSWSVMYLGPEDDHQLRIEYRPLKDTFPTEKEARNACYGYLIKIGKNPRDID